MWRKGNGPKPPQRVGSGAQRMPEGWAGSRCGIKPTGKVELLCFAKKEHNIIKFETELFSQPRGLPRPNIVPAPSAQRLFA